MSKAINEEGGYLVVGDFIRNNDGTNSIHSVICREEGPYGKDGRKTLFSMNRISGQLRLHVWHCGREIEGERHCQPVGSTAYAPLKENFLEYEREVKARRA